MTCPECLASLQRVVHREYVKGCHGCKWRALAYSTEVERQRFYQAVQHVSGVADAHEAKRCVDLERARIAALSAAMPRKERA